MNPETIDVTLNGEPTSIAEGTTVRRLLERLSLADAAVAVAVNGTFVPRSRHAAHVVREGDAIELVAPMQGG